MQLKLDALTTHLQGNFLAPLYILHGDEPLLLIETSDLLRQAARARGYVHRKILLVERNFCWSALFSAAQSQSLFDGQPLIDLRIPSGKPGKEGAQALQDYVAQQVKAQYSSAQYHSDIFTLITLPRMDMASQKSAWFSTLEQAGVVIKIDKIERAQLPQWLVQRLSKQGQAFESGLAGKQAMQFLVERVEGNLLAAHQEIQKLGLLYPPGPLSLLQIQEAVLNVARYDVFKLSEAMLEGDVPRLVRMLEGLQGEGTAPVLVLWALVEEIRLLCKLRQGVDEGRPLSTLMREHRVWGLRERLLPQALQRLNKETLSGALTLAAQLDRQAKGLRDDRLPDDIWENMQTLSLQIALPSAMLNFQ